MNRIIKFLNEHKVIILCYIVMVIFALWFSGQVEKTDKEVSQAKNSQVEKWSVE